MGIKFKDIINENEGKSNKIDRFIDFLIPKLKDYFGKKYRDHDWISAASISATMDIDGIKESIKNVKNLSKELLVIQNQLSKIDTLVGSQIKPLNDRSFQINKVLRENLLTINIIDNHYADFIKTYDIPINIFIPLIEKFRDEVYKPAKIEMLKKQGIDGVEYSTELPENVKFLDTFHSGRGSNFYGIYSVDGRFLVTVKLDWNNDSGVYYVYVDDKKEIMDLVNYYEHKDLMSHLKGSFDGNYTEDFFKPIIKTLDGVHIDELLTLYSEEGEDAESTMYEIFRGVSPSTNWRFEGFRDYQTFFTVYMRYRERVDYIERKLNSSTDIR